MAHNWGVVPYAYEGGTQAGGDWGGQNLFYADQFKWDHPISKRADDNWAHYWHNFGGFNAFYYYPGFEYGQIHRAEDYQPWAAAIDRAKTWVLEPEGVRAAPLTITPDQPHYESQPGSTWNLWAHPHQDNPRHAHPDDLDLLDAPGMWKGDVFRAPTAGVYRITADTTTGGTAMLLINDSQQRVDGPSGTTLEAEVFLTQGVHGVRVQNIDGRFDLRQIRVEPVDD